MWALLVVLLWGLPLGGLGASRFHERNHTGLLFLYDFTEGQVPILPPDVVRDVSGRYLMGNLTASTTGAVAWGVTRQGMAVPSVSGGLRAVSQGTSSAVTSLITDEWTIELFFRSPNNPLSTNVHIAGVGDFGPPGSPYVQICGSSQSKVGNWAMWSYLGGVINFGATLMVDDVPACVTTSLAITPNTLRHFVARFHSGELSVVSHGNDAFNGANDPTFSASLWANHSAPLTLANPHEATGWTGTIYMVAMYNRYLSNGEIAANRGFGPPNSFPYGAGAVEADEDTPATLVSAA